MTTSDFDFMMEPKQDTPAPFNFFIMLSEGNKEQPVDCGKGYRTVEEAFAAARLALEAEKVRNPGRCLYFGVLTLGNDGVYQMGAEEPIEACVSRLEL